MIVGISGYIGSGKDTLAQAIRIALKGYDTYDFIQYKDSAITGAGYIKKFAGSLKEIVAILTGCNVVDLEDADFKNKVLPEIWNRTDIEALNWLLQKDYMFVASYTPDRLRQFAREKGFKFERTYRELLQELGTNVMREHLHPDVWVNALMSHYKPLPPKAKNIQNWGTSEPIKVKEEYPLWFITDVRFPNEAEAIKGHGGIIIRIDPKGHIQLGPGDKFMEEKVRHISETALDKYKHFDYRFTNSGTLGDLFAEGQKIIQQFKLHEYATNN